MTHFHHATPVIGISDVNAGAVRLADDATDELGDLVLESGHTNVCHWEIEIFPHPLVDNKSALVQNTYI